MSYGLGLLWGDVHHILPYGDQQYAALALHKSGWPAIQGPTYPSTFKYDRILGAGCIAQAQAAHQSLNHKAKSQCLIRENLFHQHLLWLYKVETVFLISVSFLPCGNFW